MSSVEELDSNFAPLESNDEFDWYDAAQMPLQGLGWRGESDDFCRVPNRAKGVVRDAIWELSRHSTGVSLDFTTDAKSISVRWTLRNEELAMPHMPATGVSGVDLYALRDGKWRWFSVGIPSGEDSEAVLATDLDGEMREYRLYLPLYNGVSSVHIGVTHGAVFSAGSSASESKKPICFYGSSIVHGGCASRPGMAYPAILSRRLNYPAINFGFSGNGHSEPEVADLLAELDPEVYVLDTLPNMNPDMIRENLGALIEKLRAARPQTPIVLVENVRPEGAFWQQKFLEYEQNNNAAARPIFDALHASDANLHLVSRVDLFGDDGDATVDGIHPTDLGFLRMADAIAPTLEALL